MSLREEWPRLTPRERDAKVAEALGHTLHAYRPLANNQWVKPPGECPEPAFRIAWEDADLTLSVRGLHPYSTTWEHAGPLLDRLREEGWFPSLTLRPEICAFHAFRVAKVTFQEEDYFGCLAATGPEAISLAFCLSREVPDAAQ